MTRIPVVTVLALIAFAPALSAQDGGLIWQQTYDPTTRSDRANAIAVDASAAYVVGIADMMGTTYYGQWRVQKRDLAAGSLLWEQIVLSTAPTRSVVPQGVAVDGSGVYVAGYEHIPNGTGFKVAWRVEKRSLADGSLLWSQVPAPRTPNDAAKAVAVDGTGLYVAGSELKSGDANYQWRIEKRSLLTGAVVWTVASNPSTAEDLVYAVAVDGTGLYIAGQQIVKGGYEAWRIEKRNLSTGALIWSVMNNPTSSDWGWNADRPYAIAVDSTGLYAAGGDAGVTDGLTWNMQWRLEKRSLTNGAVLWTQRSNYGNGADIAYSVALDGAGGMFVAGIDSAPGSNEWRIEKRSTGTGAVVWSQVGDYSAGDDVASAVAASGSTFYVAGLDNATGSQEWRVEKRQ